MNIRNLLLGSIAAAGLATGAQAADLGVLTSLDVCDSLGLSGLTISSDTNCLQITGGINYEFVWGSYKDGTGKAATDASVNSHVGIAADDGFNDWQSKVEAWIKFVATADSDFGPAKAVIKIKDEQFRKTYGDTTALNPDGSYAATFLDGDDTGGAIFDEAYVSVGDSTVLMAGKKGSIVNKGDDEPFNFLGLFNSEDVDVGVNWDTISGNLDTGGHVIQIVSDLGNGISVGAGLENLNDSIPAYAGTAVGYIAYAGDNLTAHLSVLAGGVLDGTVEEYGYHAGLTATFDAFKIRGALAGVHNTVLNQTNWQGLLSAQATFDMFTLAASVEGVNTNGTQALGFGGSAGFAVTDGIQINLGGRYFDEDTSVADTESYQIAAQLVAAVTETLKLTGEIGVYGSNSTSLGGTLGTYENVFYGSAEVAWAPGGDFTTSLKGTAYSNGGYKATFKAAKTFQ